MPFPQLVVFNVAGHHDQNAVSRTLPLNDGCNGLNVHITKLQGTNCSKPLAPAENWLGNIVVVDVKLSVLASCYT